MNSREEIFEVLSRLLVDMLEVDASTISPSANLYEDLDVDSIDAVDLIVELQNITGKQIDPDQFKAVRTLNDVVSAVASILDVE
jgi:acyl carrier protein